MTKKRSDRAKVADLHERAMDAAEDAMYGSGRWNAASASRMFAIAYRLESRAAFLCRSGPEPTRSVLHRSAASLALDCGKLAEALVLADRGIEGANPRAKPPWDIVAELVDVRQTALAGLLLPTAWV